MTHLRLTAFIALVIGTWAVYLGAQIYPRL